MPGFRIAGLGGTPDFPVVSGIGTEYYYKYSWVIESLFVNQDRPARISAADPEIHLKDATLPTFTVNKETVMGGSLEYKFAKSVSYDDVKVTWYDTVGMLDVMREWRDLVWNPQDGLSAGRQYKHRSTITHFLPHTSTSGALASNGTRQHILINSWPSIIRHGELTYTDSDVKLVEVTITYDWAESQ